jgi:outer membrane protein assembly factor BamB
MPAGNARPGLLRKMYYLRRCNRAPDHLLIVGKQNTPNIFFAVDDSIGDTLWTFSIPSSSGSAQFVAAQNDSMVFLGGQNGLGLYAVYRSTGVEKWFKPIGTLYTRNLILDGERLYIDRDSLYCVNIGDGSSAWSYPFSNQGSPAVDDDMFTQRRMTHLWRAPKQREKSSGRIGSTA